MNFLSLTSGIKGLMFKITVTILLGVLSIKMGTAYQCCVLDLGKTEFSDLVLSARGISFNP